jgi:hypothetical protein
MSKVAIDIDDTLYSFSDLAQEMITKVAIKRGDKALKNGVYSSWHEWRTPNDLLDEEWQSIIDLCHQDHTIRSQMPFKNAALVLRKIFDMGHDIVYISNRAESTYNVTKEWLQNYNFPQANSLICTTENKASFIKDCQYIIDDRPKTLVEFVYDYEWNENRIYDRVGFGLFCEYNRALTDVPGIYLAPNWALLEKYIEEKSDLLNG